MAEPTLTSTYGDNPWAGLTDKTRGHYVPDLMNVFSQNSVYQQFVPFRVNLSDEHTDAMTFSLMYALDQNIDPIGLRQMYINPQRTDTESRTIYMEHHGDKVAMHKFDDLISIWKKNGVQGLRQIIRGQLGESMVRYLERLARNSFLSGTFHLYGAAGAKANFGALVNGTDNFDPAMADAVFLGMGYRSYHGSPEAGSQEDRIIAITSPSVIASIRANPEWIANQRSANPGILLNREVGSYRGVSYVESPDATLWNAGVITTRATVVEPIYPGNGAARNVDANRVVGQAVLDNGNRYIQCDALDDLSDIAVGDIITIHRVVTSAYGVTDGVDYRAGGNTERRVVTVDDTTKRIAVDRPILLDDYMTDLGSGVYGYITKAATIHATAFITGQSPVVAGVSQSPQVYTPRPIDDFEAYYRVTWDAYIKYQIWQDSSVEVVFNTGQYRLKGLPRY